MASGSLNKGTEARAPESERSRSPTFPGVLEKLSSEARSDLKSMKRSSEYKSIQLWGGHTDDFYGFQRKCSEDLWAALSR